MRKAIGLSVAISIVIGVLALAVIIAIIFSKRDMEAINQLEEKSKGLFRILTNKEMLDIAELQVRNIANPTIREDMKAQVLKSLEAEQLANAERKEFLKELKEIKEPKKETFWTLMLAGVVFFLGVITKPLIDVAQEAVKKKLTDRMKASFLKTGDALFMDQVNGALRLQVWCEGKGTKQATVKSISISDAQGNVVVPEETATLDLEWTGKEKGEKPILRPERKTDSVTVLFCTLDRRVTIYGVTHKEEITDKLKEGEVYSITLEIDDHEAGVAPLRKSFTFKSVGTESKFAISPHPEEVIVPPRKFTGF